MENKFKKFSLKTLISALIILLFFAPIITPVLAKDATIEITQNGFSPTNIIIQLGDTITFTNKDDKDHWPASDLHPTHTIFPEFDPKQPITTQNSWSFTPKRIGTFNFHDHLIPSKKGTLIVNTSPESSSSSSVNIDQTSNASFLTKVKMFFQRIFSNLAFWKNNNPQTTKDDIQNFNQGIRPKEESENNLNYIRAQMEICFKNGGKNDCYKNVANQFSKQFGLKQTLQLFHDGEKYPEIYSRCHEVTHYLSRNEYLKLKSVPDVINQCSFVCHGGCYHGTIEGFLEEKSTTNTQNADPLSTVQAEIPKVCGQITDYQSPLVYYECLHGIGHGAMFITDSELPQALKLCDFLDTTGQKETCYSGVFMENSSSSTNLDHPSKYIKASDILYPCNILEEKYLPLCYTYQSSYYAQLANWQWEKVSQMCMQVPAPYRQKCFQTMGTNQVGFTQNIDTMISNCKLAPGFVYQNTCIKGVVTSFGGRFADEPDYLLNFCSKVDPEFKPGCYEQMGIAISAWTQDLEKRSQICNKIEQTRYQSLCQKAQQEGANL